MTHETIKALLMIVMIGSLLGAVQMPKTWVTKTWISKSWASKSRASRPAAFLVRAIAHLRSTLVLADRTLQPAFVRRKSHHRQTSLDVR